MTILESQVMEIEEDLTVLDEDLTGLEVDLTELEGDVNFLLDEQVIQDERLLTLEQTTDAINVELEGEVLNVILLNSYFNLLGDIILLCISPRKKTLFKMFVASAIWFQGFGGSSW